MSIDILLVEDNEGDARLLREICLKLIRSLVSMWLPTDLRPWRFSGTRDAISMHLAPTSSCWTCTCPRWMVLKSWRRSRPNPWLRTIPIIVLTTSQAEADIVQSYKLMASCYLAKPGEWKEFESLVKSLNDFWLTKVTFPKQRQPAGQP